MITIIKSFLWIMVFRQGPDALPVSAFLARACIVINVLVSALTNIILLTQEPWSVTLIRTLLILLINILLIWTVLRLRSFSHRFNQTISAFILIMFSYRLSELLLGLI